MTTKPNHTCLGKPSTDWNCDECGEKTITVYIGRCHDGVNVCFSCVCKAFGVQWSFLVNEDSA